MTARRCGPWWQVAHAEPINGRDCVHRSASDRSHRRGECLRRRGRSVMATELQTIAQVCEELQVARSTIDQ